MKIIKIINLILVIILAGALITRNNYLLHLSGFLLVIFLWVWFIVAFNRWMDSFKG